MIVLLSVAVIAIVCKSELKSTHAGFIQGTYYEHSEGGHLLRQHHLTELRL